MFRNLLFFIPLVLVLSFGSDNAFGLTPPPKEPLPCINKKFTIIAHIVRDTSGLPNVSQAAINSALATVNQFFAPICVSFEICEFRYIDNFQYDFLKKPEEWDEIQIKYHEKNRINMFFVGATDDGSSFATLGGITSLNSGGLVIVKSHGGLVYTHEMGHYFGLAHTFEGAGTPGAELVDGSNSSTAGDQIIDTPADPYIGAQNLNGCRYVGMVQDANGDYYNPHVGNIMSYYDSACKCEFTYEQYKSMANLYLTSNPKMW